MNRLPSEILEIIAKNMTPRNIRALMSTSTYYRNSNVLRRIYNNKMRRRRLISGQARFISKSPASRGRWANMKRKRNNN